MLDSLVDFAAEKHDTSGSQEYGFAGRGSSAPRAIKPINSACIQTLAKTRWDTLLAISWWTSPVLFKVDQGPSHMQLFEIVCPPRTACITYTWPSWPFSWQILSMYVPRRPTNSSDMTSSLFGDGPMESEIFYNCFRHDWLHDRIPIGSLYNPPNVLAACPAPFVRFYRQVGSLQRAKMSSWWHKLWFVQMTLKALLRARIRMPLPSQGLWGASWCPASKSAGALARPWSLSTVTAALCIRHLQSLARLSTKTHRTMVGK